MIGWVASAGAREIDISLVGGQAIHINLCCFFTTVACKIHGI